MVNSKRNIKFNRAETFDIENHSTEISAGSRLKHKLFRYLSLSVKVLFVLLFFLFIVVPVVYRSSYSVQKVFLFLNFVKWPLSFDLSEPSQFGLEGTRNFYITSEDNVKLGVWHVLPASLIEESEQSKADENQYNNWLKNGRPIIVYAHGNSGHRGADHRCQLYRVLRKSEFHIITFDYRGYGDSSDHPIDEIGLVQDTLTVYRWVQNQSKENLFIWGHSLGTGISSHAMNILHSENNEPTGLVLEAPFNNLVDEVREHPFSKIFTIFPWFDFFFTTPMYDNGLKFESDKNLQNVTSPILILHAKDDGIVPYVLGVRLYNSILNYRKTTNQNTSDLVEMVSYDANKHYGHKYICDDPDLPETIEKFIDKAVKRKNGES